MNEIDSKPAEGGEKAEKSKLVRDSFTIPKAEYAALNELKQRATRLAQPAKKSELLRAGIALLKGLSDQALKDALAAVPNLKTGRPAKDGDEGGEPAPRVGKRIIDKTVDRAAKADGAGKAAARANKPARANNPARAAKLAGAEKPAKPARANKPAKPAKPAKAMNPARAARLARKA